MEKWLLALFIGIMIFASCNKNEESLIFKQENYTILKERDPNYPWIPYQKSTLSRATPTIIGLKDCMGRSLKCNTFPIENIENLGYPVIDMDKFTKDYPTYFTSWRLGNESAESFSFANFDRFIENSNIKKNVSNGFSLNLGIFKLGHKKKMSEIFSTSLIENNQCVFGMLNILVKDSCYNLLLSSNIKNKIITNYLHPMFREELYNTSPSEFFSNYGGFVLSNYITGGKALGFYCGIYKQSETSETKEHNMNKEISGSFGFKKDSISGSWGFGKNFANGNSSTNTFSSLQTSIQTIGGASGSTAISIPQDINTINVDLSEWMKSLKDSKNNSIISVLENGLIPITDFIVEENLKDAFLDIYKNGVTNITSMQEPYILFSQGEGTLSGVTWYIYLITRFGDQILLRTRFANPWNNFPESIQDELQRISNIFGLKIVQDLNLDGFDGAVSGPSYDEEIPFDAFAENNMTKFIDENNGVIYLLYTDENNKFAYSIHYDKIIDEYVMRNFVDRLTLANINMSTLLKEYKIKAL